MEIVSIAEFMDKVMDFHDELVKYRDKAQYEAVHMGDIKAVSKLTMLNQLLLDYTDLFEYASLNIRDWET